MSELLDLKQMLEEKLSLKVISSFTTGLENIVGEKKRYIVSFQKVIDNKIQLIKSVKKVKI